jgi:hypothetical protein
MYPTVRLVNGEFRTRPRIKAGRLAFVVFLALIDAALWAGIVWFAVCVRGWL